MRDFSAGARALGALAAVLLLVGCKASGETVVVRACPVVTVLAEAAAVTKYRPGRGRDLTDVVTDARILAARGECEFGRRAVSMKVGVNFSFAIGPANRDRTVALSYFVAIVDGANNVLAREEFPIEVQAPVNQSRITRADEVEPRIPFQERNQLAGYRVFVGFVLTPEEAQAARRRRQ